MVFLILSLFFGLLFVFFTPPFGVSDEVFHFYKSYSTSEFQIWPVQHEGAYGYFFPRSILDFPGNLWPNENLPAFFPLAPGGTALLYESVVSQIAVPLDPDNIRFYSFGNFGANSPVGYLPQAGGMLIGRLLHLSPLLIFYCGRLANLGIWIFLIYLAIRTIPVGKWLVAGISLLPMSVYQSASLSPDALNNGICTLFIAFVIYLAMNRNSARSISRIEIVTLLVMCVAISLLKWYFVLAFLAFIIPPGAFRSRNDYWFSVLGIGLISAIVCILWQASISFTPFVNPYPSLKNFSPTLQFQFLITNPVDFGWIVLTTLFIMYGYYWITFIGIFGWGQFPLPVFEIYYIFFFVLLVLALIDNDQTNFLNTKQKLISIAIFVTLTLLIETAEWITFTPVGASEISGVTGRYFIPIALLVFCLLSNSYAINPKIKKICIVSIFCFIIGTLLLSLYYLYKIYYISHIPRYYLAILIFCVNLVILTGCYIHLNLNTRLSDIFNRNSFSSLLLPLIFTLELSIIVFTLFFTPSSFGIASNCENTLIGPFGEEVTIGQSFYSTGPRLNSVSMQFILPNRTNENEIIFHLREAPDSSKDIASSTLSSGSVYNNSYWKFVFPTIDDSAGKNYYFFVESPGSDLKNGMMLTASTSDVYPLGSAYLNSTPGQQDLKFIIGHVT